MSESADSLLERLNVYKEQLKQLEELSSGNEQNEDILKAKNDLIELIALTNGLYQTAIEKQKQLQKAIAPTNVSSIQVSVSTSSTATIQPKSNVLRTNAGGVKIVPQFQVGAKVMAKFANDGMWYEAKVEKVPVYAGDKYTITFIGYGDQAEVGVDEIGPLSVSEKQSQSKTLKKHKREEENITSSASAAKNSESDEKPKIIMIPKSLRPLPTDSEEVQKMKRRKIHAIKSQNRLKKQEEERNIAKTTWQTFLTSAKSSKAKIPLTKQSIFRSPDTIEGKVGVTGSGTPLTKQQIWKPTNVKKQTEEVGDNEEDDENIEFVDDEKLQYIDA